MKEQFQGLLRNIAISSVMIGLSFRSVSVGLSVFFAFFSLASIVEYMCYTIVNLLKNETTTDERAEPKAD